MSIGAAMIFSHSALLFPKMSANSYVTDAKKKNPGIAWSATAPKAP